MIVISKLKYISKTIEVEDSERKYRFAIILLKLLLNYIPLPSQDLLFTVD